MVGGIFGVSIITLKTNVDLVTETWFFGHYKSVQLKRLLGWTNTILDLSKLNRRRVEKWG